LGSTNKEAGTVSPGNGTVSAADGRGADDHDHVALPPPVTVADTSERAPPRDMNEAAAVPDVAWQPKLDRAEETAGQLYKLAEAAQAAIDVLRAKLANAEAEIDRIGRGRTAVAEELHRQANEYEALDSVRKELERKCGALAAEAFNIARDRDRLLDERVAGLSILIDPAFDPLFWHPARLGACSAWWGHVPFAHWLIRAAAPELLVELGTLTGVSYSAFCHAVLEAGLPTLCQAVGTWCGDRQAGETNDEVYEDFRRFHDRHYDKFSTLLQRTFDTLERFSDGSIDLLHIAGPQIHLSARHDFESWLPKLSKRGIVLLHATNLRDDDCGIWRFWEELRGRYPSFEFLHGYGLGVLAVGEAAPAAVLALCRLTDPAAIATLRGRFALIGERWFQMERLEAFESAVARGQAQSQELRSQVEALDSAMQARTASFQIEIERVEAMAVDRAMAAEMAENVAALKAGELNRARAEIAASSARISRTAAGPLGRIAGSWREAARRLRSLKRRVARPPGSQAGS
jgi:Methyltransferase domain